jgi:hypothetical protein
MSERYDYLIERELTHEVEVLQASISKGQCADFGDYKFTAGQICGIQTAMRIMKDARLKAEQGVGA